MIIAMLVRHYPPEKNVGGVAIATANLVKYYTKIYPKHIIHVVTASESGKKRLIVCENVVIHRINLRSKGLVMQGLEYLFKAFFCLKILHPDIIHVQGLGHSIPAYFCNKIYQIPYCVTAHGSDARGKKISFSVKSALKIFVATPDLIKYVPSSTLLLNPIDLSEYPLVTKNINNESVIRIIHAPSSPKIKGTAYIVDVINRLISQGYLIDFRLIENMPHDHLIFEFRDADIIIDQVLLGWYGMVSIEAMALGKPVCTRIDPELEMYIPENTIMNCDKDTLFEKLAYLINNPDVRNKYAKNGRKYVEDNHDVAQICKRLCETYTGIKDN